MKNPGEFILGLMNARTAAHVLHLQTGSYAQHMALGDFYDGIVPLIDSFAEAYQGFYGVISFTGASFKLEKAPLAMLNGVKATLAKARAECQETSLQNIIDEMSALTASTIYKITRLQ